MKRLARTLPHNLAALQSELLAAIPALRPTPTGLDGRSMAAMAIMGDGSALVMEVPDNADEGAIDAVLAAHTNPPPPEPVVIDYGTDPEDIGNLAAVQTAVQNLRAYVALGSPTAAQSAAALKLTIRLVLAIVRRMV